ncbi:alpha/beta fold hydrolase, partial [Dokdonella soli]
YEAPQGEIETTLARIWSELLGHERVGRHDNFFELGGHSLLAVQMVSLLEQQGSRISIIDLFERPTISSLAARIASKELHPLSEAVHMNRGGSKRPLFFLPEGSGSLQYAFLLRSFIDREIPIYGIPEPDDLPRTVQGMATRIVRIIRAIQAEGPYRLAGWSVGGTLAYEVSVQLIGQNQAVEFLGLMDTYYVPNELSGAAYANPTSEPHANFLSLVHNSAVEKGISDEIIAAFEPQAARLDLAALIATSKELAILPATLEGMALPQIQAVLDREQIVRTAVDEYQACPISVPLYLFSAQGDRPEWPYRGWDEVISPSRIRLKSVPGTHMTMMQSPHIDKLGSMLNEALKDAEKNPVETPEKDYSPVMILQRGSPTETTLFCVPGAGANVAAFGKFVTCLSEFWPIYGLQPRGVDGALTPHSTVFAAADTCLNAIQRAKPNGPIHLLGHSFGGWIAFEIANRLSALGRPPASVTIVDCEAPSETDAIIEYDRADVMMELVTVLEQLYERPINLRRSDVQECNERRQLELLHREMVRLGQMPKRSEPDVLMGTLRTFASCLRTQYKPATVYPGQVRLVLLQNPVSDEDADRREQSRLIEGWRNWAPNLSHWKGPGNHMTAFDLPHVRVIANWLRDLLKKQSQ